MIECKQESEFLKTWEKTLEFDGKKSNQLFSYFYQEQKTEIIMLYTFSFENKKPLMKIIPIRDDMRNTNNLEECFSNWTKEFSEKGFFDEEPYKTKFSRILRRKDLEQITPSTGKGNFNSFAETLRKWTVSDKSNAFNKLFNLFICKIIDEDKNANDVLDFQYKENESLEDLIGRLNSLYKKGMDKFLDKNIVDFSDDEMSDISTNLKEQIKALRLYKNQEFAFTEVFNKDSFNDNAKIVKEVVQLLQPYQFRYSHKQPYLGEFFENLLNSGFKQENGQFFTPIPIAEFIIKSIPFKEIMQNLDDVIPSVIDYACGSGHFLTEAMDEIQWLLESETFNNKGRDLEKKIKAWKENQYSWAKDFIYGIESDYRLTKTTKVACFLNGDGEANIIHSNGLYRLGHKTYNNVKLQRKEQFDLVLANPPYSVDNFLHQLSEEDKENFSMYKMSTRGTNDIETFFVERTLQLLKEGGTCAIILPESILNNDDKLYLEARRILTQEFKIRALVSLGDSAFMATGTKTVIVFATKDTKTRTKIRNTIEQYFESEKDFNANEIENIVSLYVKETLEESFSEYITRKASMDTTELELEKERLLTFILNYNMVIPVVNAKEKELAKDFLGYSWSTRRGQEGMQEYSEGKLYAGQFLKDENDYGKVNTEKSKDDVTKANYYIRQSFLGQIKLDNVIDEEIKEHVFIARVSSLFNWDSKSNYSSIRLKKKLKIVSKYELKLLDDYVDFLPKSKRAASYGKKEGKYPFFTSSFNVQYCDEYDYEDESIIVGDGGNSSVHIASYFSASDHNFIFKSNSSVLLNKWVFYFLYNNMSYLQNGLLGSGLQNIGKTYMQNLEIPLPSRPEQQAIVEQMEAIDKQIEQARDIIAQQEQAMKEIDLSIYHKVKLGDEKYFSILVGGDIPKDRYSKYFTDKYNIPIYGNSSDRTIYGYTDITKVTKPSISISARGTIGHIEIHEDIFYPIVRLLVIEPTEEVNLTYLKHAVKLSILSPSGAIIPQLTKPELVESSINLPLLDEQARLVTIFNKHEYEINRQQKIINQLEQQKQSIMQEVFTIEEVL